MSEQVELMIRTGAAAASMSLADVPETNTGKGETKKPNIIALVTYVVAVTCFVLSILALATAPDNWKKNIIYTAFIISLFTSIAVIIQRHLLAQMETLREVMNDVRDEANRLQGENDELSIQNNLLKDQAKKVEDLEKQLSDVCAAQGQSVDTFVTLVKENAGILKEIKEQMKARTMSDFMTVLLTSDRDQDFTIDPNEIGALIFRLESQSGVKINKELFIKELEKCNYKLEGVIELVKDIADDGSAVFTIDPENPNI